MMQRRAKLNKMEMEDSKKNSRWTSLRTSLAQTIRIR